MIRIGNQRALIWFDISELKKETDHWDSFDI